MTEKAETLDTADYFPSDILRELIFAMQDADREFEKRAESGTKNYVLNYLWPEMKKRKLVISVHDPLTTKREA